MLAIPFLVYLMAFVLTIASAATSKVPLWIPVLLLSIGLMVATAH